MMRQVGKYAVHDEQAGNDTYEDSYKNPYRPRHSQDHKATLCQRDLDSIK